MVTVAAAFKPRFQIKQSARRRATVESNAGKKIRASLRDANEEKTFTAG